MRVNFVLAVICALIVSSSVLAEEKTPASGAEMEYLKAQMGRLQENLNQFQKQHEKEVLELQGRIRELADELDRQRSQREPEPAIIYEEFREDVSPAGYQAPQQPGRVSWQSFNPDISVIGDVLAQYTSHENGGDRPDDEFIFRELEVNFSGALDPFARADVTIAIHREFEYEEHEEEDGEDHHHESPRGHGHAHGFAMHIEEAYLTALSLPHGLQARVGRIREQFGKVNPVHLHALPWVDYPLIIKNYLGTEGMVGDGVEVSWLAPTDHYLEIVYEVFNSDNALSFAGEDYDDFVQLVRVNNLFEISDAATLELGGSVATAPNDSGHGGSRTWLEGLDLTLKWRPPEQALYKGLTWQTEALFSQKDTEDGEVDTWGVYSSLEHQFSRRWAAALRYDYSEFPDFENFREHACSAYLTFIQSEFVFWRLGYMFVDRNFADPIDEDEHLLWVQLDFGLGPHRPHKY